MGRGCAIAIAATITNKADKNDFFIEALFNVNSFEDSEIILFVNK